MAVRFDKSPIDNAGALAQFVRMRASYVAQTSLFGYLKTRMGTRFTVYFEDPVFSDTIRQAAAKLYASCLSDLTVYAVGLCAQSSGFRADQAGALARAIYAEGLEHTFQGEDARLAPPDASDSFAARIDLLSWSEATVIGVTFAGSTADIVRFAPVADEFKQLDQEIVSNSLRFRWNDAREQLRRRINATAVCSDWLDPAGSSVMQTR